MSQTFPEGFLWGASTSAAQIEGGYDEGGRTPSIWDLAPKEKIKDGSDCHFACDHYDHYKEDVAIMKKLGLKSYRFSLSWPRIISEEGKINEDGLAFYNLLIDELIKNGIEPILTLYHWDLPEWQHKKGGWLNKKVIDDFAFFVKAAVVAFSDRVKYWITFNEPQCFLMNGYMQGVHAPFKRDYLALPKFTKVFMLANAKAVKTIRENAKQKPIIGLSFAAGAFIPDDENDPSSIEKARKNSFFKGMGAMNNRWWMDPILLGKPVRNYLIYATKQKDMKDFKVDFDFIGINNYEAFNYALWGGDKNVDRSKFKKSFLGWVIDGRSLYWTLRFIYERYHLPIMVTENGIALADQAKGGVVSDPLREEYLDEYLSYMKKAMDDGVPVIGYQHWSLLDNFEWAEGYAPRFGLVHVDYKTFKRTIKNSAYHYSSIIANNGGDIR